jgi:hypothetical protein
MDNVITSIINLLVNQGLSGIIIIILLYAVNYLQRINEKLQDQRVSELRTVIEVVSRNTEAVNSIITVIKGCPNTND